MKEMIMNELGLTAEQIERLSNKSGYDITRLSEMIEQGELTSNFLNDVDGNEKDYVWYEDITTGDRGWLYDIEAGRMVHEMDYKEIMKINF